MRPQLSKNETELLQRLVDTTARRLQRSLKLPQQDLNDLRQELFVDVWARLLHFDPNFGSLEALTGTILRHKASQIANRVLGSSRLAGASVVSLDEAIFKAPGTRPGDFISEDQSLWPSWRDPIADLELRLDLEQAISSLDERGRELARALSMDSAHELARKGFGVRSELYRRVRLLRLEFLAAGLKKR